MQHEQSTISNDDESGPASAPRPAPLVISPYEPLPPRLLTRIDQGRHVGIYGVFDADLLAAQAASFISSNSDANKELLVKVMYKFLACAQKDCLAGVSTVKEFKVRAVHSCWFDIRMTMPTDEWVVPRWHTDGRMFHCTCPEPQTPHSKYAFTILGPSTRAKMSNPLVNGVLQTLSETGRPWNQNSPDPELAARLAEYPEATVQLGQVIRFSWGEHDSPVHSEPDSTGLHRVFISILFGSEHEIRDMCDLRGEKYGPWR